jgi:hypothetical protein
MEKGAQFYLIAAVFIVIVLISLTSLSTYIVLKAEPKTIDDITTDLSRESYSIIEYGVYNKEEIDDLLTKFSGDDVGDYFLKKLGDTSNIIFIYGDASGLNILQYNQQVVGKVNLGSAGWQNYKNFATIKKISSDELVGKKSIEVELLNSVYPFEIRNNEMFYFIVASQRDGEVFVEKNDKIKGGKGGKV